MSNEVKAGYGYTLVKLGKPILETDEFLCPDDQAWWPTGCVDAICSSNHFPHRRRIDPGEGWEIVPEKEIESELMHYTRDGLNWYRNHGYDLPAKTVGSYLDVGVIAFRRRKSKPDTIKAAPACFVLPQIPDWISTEAARPSGGPIVFLYSRDNCEAWVGHFTMEGRSAGTRVTHWLPLPETPKSEAEFAYEEFIKTTQTDGSPRAVFCAGFEAAKGASK